MSAPAISVILPAYNAQQYLHQAIASVLEQSFQDFELVILNDGSIDGTEEIILSFNDRRIKYINNNTNKGLIFTLNKGIDIALGKYIARMDADDVCLLNRLEKQKAWLDGNANTMAVGSLVSFIDENNNPIGVWQLDQQTTSAKSILQTMPKENCLAHPSVMIRSDVVKKYKYNDHQKNTEDYDLWLRLLADGNMIEKVPEELLLYRVHKASVTGSILRKSNPFFKQFNCKKIFLEERIEKGKFGLFESKVLIETIHDGIMGVGKNIKEKIKN